MGPGTKMRHSFFIVAFVAASASEYEQIRISTDLENTMDKVRKYKVPDPIASALAQSDYERWLDRKAVAYARRDRERGYAMVAVPSYKMAIHEAVLRSNGSDEYTGEALDWALCCTYSNEESQRSRRYYKEKLALLPTVNRVDVGLEGSDFKICAWRTNEAKNELPREDFATLCRATKN